MDFLSARKLIEDYIPMSTQEEQDKIMFLQCLDAFKEKAFDRDVLVGHVTASAIVLNQDHTKVLFAYHNIYKSFSWLGGHNDGEFSYYDVARKEVEEESGLTSFKDLSDDIISIECLPVNAHIKRGKYIPYHLHFNVSYVFEANENDNIRIKEDENSSIKWINISDIDEVVNEKQMLFIYHKIINKVLKGE